MRAALSAVLLLVSMAARAELPGWRGVDHFGIAVPDIEVATEFLVEVIGCEHIISAGPFGGGHGEEVFRSLLTQEYGRSMARAGGVGFADAVQREILRLQEVE
jgi:hypothetical protein